MSLGIKIRKLRHENKISQEELADRLGIAQTSVSNIESGKTAPDFLLMQKVCEVFNVGVDYFLNTEDSFQFDKVENNKNSNIGCKIDTINNNFPEGILENMLKRLEKLEQLLNSK